MRPTELILLAVFGFYHSQKGNGQEYYDVYSDNVFHRDIQREALTDPSSSGYLAVKTVDYDSRIGHRASPTPVRVPIVYVITIVSAFLVVLIVLWLITHLVRKRNDSYEYVSVPMHDAPRLTPQISLTSTAGVTTPCIPRVTM